MLESPYPHLVSKLLSERTGLLVGLDEMHRCNAISSSHAFEGHSRLRSSIMAAAETDPTVAEMFIVSDWLSENVESVRMCPQDNGIVMDLKRDLMCTFPPSGDNLRKRQDDKRKRQRRGLYCSPSSVLGLRRYVERDVAQPGQGQPRPGRGRPGAQRALLVQAQ